MQTQSKKIFETSLFNSIVIPVAIVLIGSVLIFGVTKMLSSDRDYKDLIQELESKTFGNKWVAAYELSKVLATSKIPAEEMPGVITQLSQIYKESSDQRTQEFIIAAFASISHPLAISGLSIGLQSQNNNILFHAVSGLGNRPMEQKDLIPVDQLLQLLKDTQDDGLKLALIYTLGRFQFPQTEDALTAFLAVPSAHLRYAAATVLIAFQNEKALPLLREIALLSEEQNVKGLFAQSQIVELKLNILRACEKKWWDKMDSIVRDLANRSKNKIVQTGAEHLLLKLKK